LTKFLRTDGLNHNFAVGPGGDAKQIQALTTSVQELMKQMKT